MFYKEMFYLSSRCSNGMLQLGMLCILTNCEILSDSGTVQLSGLYLLATVAIGVLRKGIFLTYLFS